jgi:hypothetical protein
VFVPKVQGLRRSRKERYAAAPTSETQHVTARRPHGQQAAVAPGQQHARCAARGRGHRGGASAGALPLALPATAARSSRRHRCRLLALLPPLLAKAKGQRREPRPEGRPSRAARCAPARGAPDLWVASHRAAGRTGGSGVAAASALLPQLPVVLFTDCKGVE